MASINFPSSLNFQSSGYSVEPSASVKRTQMEDGSIKQARRSQKRQIVHNVTYLCTAAEYIVFRDWFNDDVESGAKYFNWTDPIDTVVKDGRFVNGVYSVAPLNNRMIHYVITAQIEVYE